MANWVTKTRALTTELTMTMMVMEKQEGDTTRPFHPASASTPYQPGDPYHGSEQTEISSMQHEKSGLPDTSYAETSFWGEDIPLLKPDLEREFVIDRLKECFPTLKRVFLQL